MSRSKHIISSLSLVLFLISLLCASSAFSKVPEEETVKKEMDEVYKIFKDLQPFLYSKQAFLAQENEKHLTGLLKSLATEFHHVGMTRHAPTQDPGFTSTLKVITEMLDDASARFAEGKKEYALWRLKTSANYCVSCHTRHEVNLQFTDSEVGLDHLNKFERAEFYLASRQFDKARELFLQVVFDKEMLSSRMDALRKWLVINTRVQPDPQDALSILNRVRSKLRLSAYEDEEVQSWLASLRRWQNESGAKVPPMVKAENLIRQGLGMEDPLTGQKGTVELLRASTMLHKLLETETSMPNAQRAHSMYLLGLTYSKLPFFFVNELPELLLEEAIRENPGSDDAKKAFRLYQEIVTQGYTGSGGTRLPDDVLSLFKELHDLAYVVPKTQKG